MSNFSFSYSVFKSLATLGCQKVSFCGNGLRSVFGKYLDFRSGQNAIIVSLTDADENGYRMLKLFFRMIDSIHIQYLFISSVTKPIPHDPKDILTLSQTTNFRLFQTERLCRRQFQIWWKWQKVLQTSRKHCGKRGNCLLRAISLFPIVFSKDFYCRHVKTRACLGKS